MPCKSSTWEKKNLTQTTAEKTMQERIEDKILKKSSIYMKVIKLRHKQCTLRQTGRFFPVLLREERLEKYIRL